MDGGNILTHSRLESFQHCRRMHYFQYILGVRPEPSEALRFGATIHKAIEEFHRIGPPVMGAIDENYNTLMSQAKDADALDAIMAEWTRARCMFAGWLWRWSAAPIEIVEAERRLELPICNPETDCPTPIFRFGAKLDAIVRLDDGRLSLYEAKTTSEDVEPDSMYWRVLRLDAQVSRYVNAARRSGFELETILYDVIRKPELTPKQIPLLDEHGLKIVIDEKGERIYNTTGEKGPRQTGDAAKGWTLQTRKETQEEYGARIMADIYHRPDHYYARREVGRVEADLMEADAEIWELQRDIQNAIRFGRHYKNAKACRRWNTICPYFDPVCSVGRDLSVEELPEGFVRLTNVHPELEE